MNSKLKKMIDDDLLRVRLMKQQMDMVEKACRRSATKREQNENRKQEKETSND